MYGTAEKVVMHGWVIKIFWLEWAGRIEKKNQYFSATFDSKGGGIVGGGSGIRGRASVYPAMFITKLFKNQVAEELDSLLGDVEKWGNGLEVFKPDDVYG